MPPPEQKPENTYCLFCINPNRITMTATHNDLNEMCYTLNSYSINTACINEHNLDTHKHTVKQKIYRTCHRQYHHSKVSLASTSIPSMTTFKPGGTMMFSQGLVTARISHQHSDPCGRWCYQTFSCKNYIKLCVITVYQPCPSSSHKTIIKSILTYHVQLTSEL